MASEFKLYLYPDGPYKQQNRITLMFTTEDERGEYIRREFKYCSREYSAYCGEMDIPKRKDLQEKLHKKRIEFARNYGFIPKKGNNRLWVKSQ